MSADGDGDERVAVDFLTELGVKGSFYNVLKNVFDRLDGKDLTSICCVSKTWCNVVKNETSTEKRRLNYVAGIRELKAEVGQENWPIKAKPNADNRLATNALGNISNHNIASSISTPQVTVPVAVQIATQISSPDTSITTPQVTEPKVAVITEAISRATPRDATVAAPTVAAPQTSTGKLIGRILYRVYDSPDSPPSPVKKMRINRTPFAKEDDRNSLIWSETNVKILSKIAVKTKRDQNVGSKASKRNLKRL